MAGAVVLVSGGMDSCVTAAMAQSDGHDLYCLHLNYGQRTERRELQAFNDLADSYEVPQDRRLVVSIEHLARIGGSSLTAEGKPVSAARPAKTEIPPLFVPV